MPVPHALVCVLAITIFAAQAAKAQEPARPTLDPAVIAAVDRLYPGFTEILERDDAAGLVRLAHVLSDHPSRESLRVLLWMLRYCPSWPNDGVLQIYKTVRAVAVLPLAPVADVLRHGNAGQRLTAAAVLANHGPLIAESEKVLLDKVLMTALADSDSAVRDMVSAALRARGSAGASPPVREYLERHSATERERGQPQQLDVPAFPRPTIALLEALDPTYRNTLGTLNEPEVRRLLEGLQRTRNAAATPVLVWLLAHGDTRAYVGNVVYQLGQQERAMRVPLGELATMLQTAEPDRKALIAELLEKVFAFRNPPGADRDRVIAALIESMAVPHVPARSKAIAALARARAPQAIRPITQLLDGPDGDRYEMSVVRSLSAIGGRYRLLPDGL
jgi:hypothetical protein